MNVSLVGCKDYVYNDVKNAVKQSVENLGGFEPYIKKNSKVLLKVNLLTKKRPEEATTTHPFVVKAIAELLIEYGVSVIIGDSPGGPFSESILKGLYKVTGMEQVCEETGATLNYNVKSARRSSPNGAILKSITITDMLNDVDHVISVSKLKSHGMMTFTGAVKNLFGVVPGLLKAEYHINMPEYDDFANALIDICQCANPVLSFMDGIIGMEGNGPSAGDPKQIGVVLASPSPYHLDKVACRIINLDFQKVPTIKKSIERGIVTDGLDDISTVGDSIDKFKVQKFVIPMNSRMAKISKNIPPFLKSFLNKHVQVRPDVNKAMCIGCKICEQNCPAKVIVMKDKKPVIDYSKCIRCYCCQELCPQKAIDIKKPMLRFRNG